MPVVLAARGRRTLKRPRVPVPALARKTATWTQAAGSVDVLYAAVKFTTPSTCTGPGGYVWTGFGVKFTLYLDGVAVNSGVGVGGPLGTTVSANIGTPGSSSFTDAYAVATYALAPVSHTLAVRAMENTPAQSRARTLWWTI